LDCNFARVLGTTFARVLAPTADVFQAGLKTSENSSFALISNSFLGAPPATADGENVADEASVVAFGPAFLQMLQSAHFFF